jgi:F-type H+-transporting ATPase subunit b
VEINITIILQIFIFVALLLWLSPMLFAPILRLFDERERRIVGSLEEAKVLNQAAIEKGKTFDEQYQNARDKARESLSLMKQATDKEHREVIDQAKHVAKEKIEQADKLLVAEENQARLELSRASEVIALDIINALTKKA